MSTQVYRQAWERTEQRSGRLGFKLTVADEYDNLFKDVPDVTVGEVDFISVTSIKQDLNDDEGR